MNQRLMKRSERCKQRSSTGLAACALALILALLWLLTLAASPNLHELVHPDADHEDHDCAVTVFLSGGFGQVVAEPIMIRQPDLELAYFSPGETRQRIIICPIIRSILEHAPPQRS
jgi:hypothetical protein